MTLQRAPSTTRSPTYAQAGDPDPSQAFRYLPFTAGAVAFAYWVQVGGALQRDIRLSGATLADIFRGRVTNWNNTAITADDNGRQFAPDLPITRWSDPTRPRSPMA